MSDGAASNGAAFRMYGRLSGHGAASRVYGRLSGRGVAFKMYYRLRVHRWFLTVFGLGALLRIVTMLGYRPTLWFPDSYTYVVTAMRPRPDLVRPAGYSMFLRLLEPFHSFALVTCVQHLLGLLTGVMIYATVLRCAPHHRGRHHRGRHHRGPRAGAAAGNTTQATSPSLTASQATSRSTSRATVLIAVLAAVPVLLDAYQIELEHMLVSDSLFIFLVVAAACLALRRPAPVDAARDTARHTATRAGTRTAVALGLLLAAATLTRTIGLPLIAVFAFFLAWYGLRERYGPGGAEAGRRVMLRVVLRRAGAFLLAALVPVAAYAGWFYAAHHRVGLIGANGVFLYARTMSFADCAIMRPSAELAVLCDPRPPADRPAPQEYVWSAGSPLARLPGITFARETDALAARFAALAIRSQPLDYAAAALTELGRAFTWQRHIYPDAETYGYYEFPASTPTPPERHPAVVGKEFAERYEQGPISVRIAEPYAGWMRTYQQVAFLPGALLLAVLLLPLARVLVARAASPTPLRRRDGLGAPWGVASVAAWTLLIVPAATVQFDYRYTLPAAPLACLAAALASLPGHRALTDPDAIPAPPR